MHQKENGREPLVIDYIRTLLPTLPRASKANEIIPRNGPEKMKNTHNNRYSSALEDQEEIQKTISGSEDR